MIINYLWEASQKRAIAQVKERKEPLIVVFVAHWSTGRFKGGESTIACIDYLTGSVLYVDNLLNFLLPRIPDGEIFLSMEGGSRRLFLFS